MAFLKVGRLVRSTLWYLVTFGAALFVAYYAMILFMADEYLNTKAFLVTAAATAGTLLVVYMLRGVWGPRASAAAEGLRRGIGLRNEIEALEALEASLAHGRDPRKVLRLARETDRIFRDNPHTKPLYREALAGLLQSDLSEAAVLYAELFPRYRFTFGADDQLRLVHTLRQTGAHELAARSLEAWIVENGGDPRLPEVLHTAAAILDKHLHERETALALYRRLAAEHPASPFAAEAQARLAEIAKH